MTDKTRAEVADLLRQTAELHVVNDCQFLPWMSTTVKASSHVQNLARLAFHDIKALIPAYERMWLDDTTLLNQTALIVEEGKWP